MKKVVYIIPGFTENTFSSKYQKIMKFFRSRNITPIPINISWKRRTMSHYTQEFLKQYQGRNGEVYVFGFSFGAMIALITSPIIKPKLLILCSLSPYFKEDLAYIKKAWKRGIGKRRFEDFRKYSFNTLSKKVKSKMILIRGGEEVSQVKRRVKDAHKKLRGSKLILIKGAKHNLAQEEYREALQKIISNL